MNPATYSVAEAFHRVRAALWELGSQIATGLGLHGRAGSMAARAARAARCADQLAESS